MVHDSFGMQCADWLSNMEAGRRTVLSVLPVQLPIQVDSLVMKWAVVKVVFAGPLTTRISVYRFTLALSPASRCECLAMLFLHIYLVRE
eukprot:2769631-Pyramimonas_sp.AAC.1